MKVSSSTCQATESPQAPIPSLFKRYSTKLFTSGLGIATGLVTMTFVPKTLGPEDFGKYEFVVNNMNVLLTSLSLSFPMAYFNWVSRKEGQEELEAAHTFAVSFFLSILLVATAIVGGAIATGLDKLFWPGIEARFLFSGLMCGAVTLGLQIMTYGADGLAFTVKFESGRLKSNLIRALLLIALFAAGWLSLSSYFLVQIVSPLLLVIGGLFFALRKNVFNSLWRRSSADVRAQRREFLAFYIRYSRPLIIYAVIGFIYSYVDRWVLQFASGSREQGYYGLAYRLSAMAFVFTSSMTPLLTREFAISVEKDDQERLRALFERIKIFVFIAAVLGVFCSVNSSTIIRSFAGSAYEGALWTVIVMSLYPIHQTFGQLSNALFLAAGRTKSYSQIGVLTMIVSIPVALVLVGGGQGIVPGLGLGSLGLGIKMVAVQFAVTNLMLFLNTRYLSVSYLPWVRFQIEICVLLFLSALMSNRTALFLCNSTSHVLGTHDAGRLYDFANLFASGSLFLICVVVIIFFRSEVLGLSKKDFLVFRARLRSKLSVLFPIFG